MSLLPAGSQYICAHHCLSCSFGILLHELITGEVPIRGQLRDLQASLWLAAWSVAMAVYALAVQAPGRSADASAHSLPCLCLARLASRVQQRLRVALCCRRLTTVPRRLWPWWSPAFRSPLSSGQQLRMYTRPSLPHCKEQLLSTDITATLQRTPLNR